MQTLRFSIPERLGTKMSIGDNVFHLTLGDNKRLTDEFLDDLIAVREKRSDKPVFTFQNGSYGEGKPVTISFNNKGMTVTRNGQEYKYDVDFDTFFKAFLDHVRSFALYYVAPCNYMAFFCKPLDAFLEKINQYRPQEAELLKKIEAYV